jgi:hypothetical protein
MPELMLRASFFPDGQLPDSSRAWLGSLLPHLSLLQWLGKSPIYGKQKTSNGQRDQGDAQGRLGLIPSTTSECKTMALPGFVST